MKVLQVNHSDRHGSRFTGFSHIDQYARAGVALDFCVWDRRDDYSHRLGSGLFGLLRKFPFKKIEYLLSIQSLIYPYSFQLSRKRQFRMADVVHYHLLHNGYFSLLDLPRLTKLKPSVWTWHDPWPLTGHCVHPYDCHKWRNGCGDCPSLETSIKMRNDNTSLMWKIKKNVYSRSRIDVVVASKWMSDLVTQSPMKEVLTVHHIPFGLDLEVFRPRSRDLSRAKLGIAQDAFVVCFRATSQAAKAMPLILDALRRLQPCRPTCLLVFDKVGLLEEFRGRFQLVELGWVEDQERMTDAYSASDVFLMPSAAESFGMMSIEAMACGVPVIVSDGTALADVVHVPLGGLSVPQGDGVRLAGEIEALMADERGRQRLAEGARSVACEHYDIRDHVRRMAELYREVAAKRAVCNG